MRVVTYVLVQILQPPTEERITVYLVSIYDKSERSTISDAQLKTLVSAIDKAAKPDS